MGKRTRLVARRLYRLSPIYTPGSWGFLGTNYDNDIVVVDC